MAAWDFADIYTRSPRACGPRALGVYISKILRSHGITITYDPYSIVYSSNLYVPVELVLAHSRLAFGIF